MSQGEANSNKEGIKGEGDYVSLINFDPLAYNNGRRINSPNSLEAFRRLGFQERDLLLKTFRDIEREGVPSEFEKDVEFYLKVKGEFLEKKRQEKLHKLLEERQRILNERVGFDVGSKDFHSGSQRDSYVNLLANDSFMEREKKRIEKMKKQQLKEIERKKLNEQKLEEIKQRQEGKKVKLQEIQRLRSVELEKRHQEAQKAHEMRERKKVEAMELSKERNEAIVHASVEKEKKWKVKQEEMTKMQKAHIEEQERKQQKKRMQIEEHLERLSVERQKELLQAQTESERHLKFKHELFEKQRLKKLQESQENREKFEKKLNNVRQSQENERKLLLEKHVEKQKTILERRENMDKEREEGVTKKHVLAETKIKEIRDSLDARDRRDAEKKRKILEKYRETEKLRQRKEEMDADARRKKKEAELQKEEKTKKNFQKSLEDMSEKNKEFLSDLNQSLTKAEKGKQKHLEDVKRKYILEHLKLEEAQQNSKRVEMLRNERKRKILERLDADGKRIAEIQKSKEDAAQERKKIEILLQEEKDKFMASIKKAHESNTGSFGYSLYENEREEVRSAVKAEKHREKTKSADIKTRKERPPKNNLPVEKKELTPRPIIEKNVRKKEHSRTASADRLEFINQYSGYESANNVPIPEKEPPVNKLISKKYIREMDKALRFGSEEVATQINILSEGKGNPEELTEIELEELSKALAKVARNQEEMLGRIQVSHQHLGLF